MNKQLHVTKQHTGKMQGLQSLSTACTINKHCKKYAAINGAICQKCFAAAMFKRYGDNFNNAFVNNYNILTSEILPLESLPVINCLYFRFEAFGDLDNEKQFINYLNIAENNPRVNFAIWTKTPAIMQNVFNMGYKKPDNLNIIVSSLFINKVANFNQYNFIDKVFTVYDKKYAAENDIKINCGARDCSTCLKCYTKNDIKYINELVK